MSGPRRACPRGAGASRGAPARALEVAPLSLGAMFSDEPFADLYAAPDAERPAAGPGDGRGGDGSGLGGAEGERDEGGSGKEAQRADKEEAKDGPSVVYDDPADCSLDVDPESLNLCKLPTLCNVISTIDLDMKVSLKLLTTRLRNAEYTPPVCRLRFFSPKGTVVISHSGKLVVQSGGLDETKIVARNALRLLELLGYNIAEKGDIHALIHNLVFVFEFKEAIRIDECSKKTQRVGI